MSIAGRDAVFSCFPQIICTSGAGAALDLLTHAFADPGGAFVVGM